MIIAAEPEASRISMANVSAVTATSYLEEARYGFVHGPANVIDGDLSSAWVEDAAVDTSSVTFTILSVYPGSTYEDTAITEISLF